MKLKPAKYRSALLRACLKIGSGAAARDFGFGRGGAGGASPQRAVTLATTKSKAKRPAALRVFVAKAGWLRCSSVKDPQGYGLPKSCELDSPNYVVRCRALQSPSSRLATQPLPQKQHHSVFSDRLLGRRLRTAREALPHA